VHTVRRIWGSEREATTEITEYDPPRRWADRGIDGPIRAMVAVTVEPLPDSSRSRVTIELDSTGHGIGKVLVPLVVRRQAARGDAGEHAATQATARAHAVGRRRAVTHVNGCCVFDGVVWT
jgi:hypothetical protein